VNLPGAPAGSSRLAGQAPKIRLSGEKNGVREDETAMADGMRVPGQAPPSCGGGRRSEVGPVSLPLQIFNGVLVLMGCRFTRLWAVKDMVRVPDAGPAIEGGPLLCIPGHFNKTNGETFLKS
jgi:hypothetical protein